MTDEDMIVFMASILQPLFSIVNSNLLSPNDKYLKLSAYIKHLEDILVDKETEE